MSSPFRYFNSSQEVIRLGHASKGIRFSRKCHHYSDTLLDVTMTPEVICRLPARLRAAAQFPDKAGDFLAGAAWRHRNLAHSKFVNLIELAQSFCQTNA